MTKPSKFDALATVLYTEHEVMPSTISPLREDSFAAAPEGYTPEDWMKLPYRKRRYITLRNRARQDSRANIAGAGSPAAAAAKAPQSLAQPQPAAEPTPDYPMDPSGEESGEGGEIVGQDDVEIPHEPVALKPMATNAFTDAIVDYVSGQPSTNRAELAEYLEKSFGDRLHTDAQINQVINAAIKSGAIILNGDNTVAVGDGEAPVDGPTDADLASLAAAGNDDEAKKSQRKEIYKKLLAWRAAQKAKGIDNSEKADEEDDDDDRRLPADKVIGRGRMSKDDADDVDWESGTGQED
jgi:hypothetical protein